MVSILNLYSEKKSINQLTVLAATLSVVLVKYSSFNKIITALKIPESSDQEQYSHFYQRFFTLVQNWL